MRAVVTLLYSANYVIAISALAPWMLGGSRMSGICPRAPGSRMPLPALAEGSPGRRRGGWVATVSWGLGAPTHSGALTLPSIVDEVWS